MKLTEIHEPTSDRDWTNGSPYTLWMYIKSKGVEYFRQHIRSNIVLIVSRKKTEMDSSVVIKLHVYLTKIISPRLFDKSIFYLLILFSLFSFVMCNNHGTPLTPNLDARAINAPRNYPD